MDVWDDSSAWDSGLYQGIEFFITTNCKLEVTWGNSPDFKVF